MKTGIDVSAWQGQINWEQTRCNGAAFAIIKTSQQLFSDQCFKQNWQGAKDADLPRGAYHYLTWDVSPVPQARFFASMIKTDLPEIYPVVDFEEANGCPANAAGLLKDFIQEVEQRLGKACMVYTSPGFWRSHGSSDPFFSERPLWIANWRVTQPIIPLPWEDFTFWQFTDKGDGLSYGVSSKSVDCSYANITISLEQFQGMPEPQSEKMQIDPAGQLARLWAAHPQLHV